MCLFLRVHVEPASYVFVMCVLYVCAFSVDFCTRACVFACVFACLCVHDCVCVQASMQTLILPALSDALIL